MAIVSDLEVRQGYILNLVRSDGQVLYDPIDLTDPEPEIAVRVKAPGGAAGHTASFKYGEVYRRSRAGYEIIEYTYGYWSQAGLGSLEYHWHPLPWSRGRGVFHIHCAAGGRDRDHYRAHAMLLEEARARFRAIYGSERAVDCSGLYPLTTS